MVVQKFLFGKKWTYQLDTFEQYKSQNDCIKVWNLFTCELINTIQFKNYSIACLISVPPTCNIFNNEIVPPLLVSGGFINNHKINIWNPYSGYEIRIIDAHCLLLPYFISSI